MDPCHRASRNRGCTHLIQVDVCHVSSIRIAYRVLVSLRPQITQDHSCVEARPFCAHDPSSLPVRSRPVPSIASIDLFDS